MTFHNLAPNVVRDLPQVQYAGQLPNQRGLKATQVNYYQLLQVARRGPVIAPRMPLVLPAQSVVDFNHRDRRHCVRNGIYRRRKEGIETRRV
jgi:hypothetical protein